MCHGLRDPLLPVEMGEASRDALQALGYQVEWNSYPMEHQVCMEEVVDISNWLQASPGAKRLTNQGPVMELHLSIGPLVSLVAGILILIMPRLLNYIVALYLIIIGLLGLFGPLRI